MKPSEALSQRLAEIRNAKGWSQRDLVKRLAEVGVKVDKASLARIEKGKRRVSVDEVFQLAAALEVSPIHLLLPKGKPTARVDITNKLRPTVDQMRQWIRGLRPLPGQDRDFMVSMAAGAGDAFVTEYQPFSISKRLEEMRLEAERFGSGQKEMIVLVESLSDSLEQLIESEQEK